MIFYLSEMVLDEFLEDFPSVSRIQAVQALELAMEISLKYTSINHCL